MTSCDQGRRAAKGRLVAGIHLVVALLGAPPAMAAPSTEAAEIESPRALEPLRAEDPPGAVGEQDVVLEITVGTDGRVEGARAVEGQEPFTGAAVAASAAWRFAPATRAGAPVRARIRVRIHFKPAVPAPVAAPSPAPATAAVTPSRAAPLEVEVTGPPRAPGAVTLSRAEVRVLPGAFGDPFRALEALPGVTPVLSGLPYFYVRGAPPGNVGYFIDGIRVPQLFHILAGPAVLPPALIDRTELYSGGYPAEYGRFAGGIVTAATRDPSPGLHGEATLRLIDAGAVVEAPLPGGVGYALAGARYSYTAPVLSLFVPTTRFDYWDYQGRVILDVTPGDRLTVLAFGSHDDVEQRDQSSWEPQFASEFHRVSLRYDARVGDATQVQQALTFGLDRANVGVGGPTLRDTSFAMRTMVTRRVSHAVLVRGGADAALDAYTVEGDYNRPGELRIPPPRQDLAAGLFVDAVFDLGRGVEITPGARVDLWSSAGARALSGDVRLAARVPLTSRVRLVSAAGLAHQAPAFIVPVPGAAIDALMGGLQKSVQASSGVEADLPLAITASMTVFYDAFFDISDPTSVPVGVTSPLPFATTAWFERPVLGSAIGMEVYVRRKLTERLGGYLAYTLSRSTRYLDGASYAAQYDRTHVLGGALSWDIGRGFRVGARATFYTGIPLTPFYPDAAVALYGRNRLSPYFRLDARAEKRWTIGSRGWLAVVLEGQNLTLAKEQSGLTCTPAGSEQPTRCAAAVIGPITLPSLGLEGGL